MVGLTKHLEKKYHLVRETPLLKDPYAFQVSLTIHGVPLCFYLQSEDLVRELYDHYPLSWFHRPVQEPPISIFWRSPDLHGWSATEWEDESLFDCFLFNEEHDTIAVQRDFAARRSGNTCLLFCPLIIADGFFNFLRWLLPARLVEKDALLLHSSCVLDQQKQAYFCLGASGAGKTTIASFRQRRKILGDDMNIIKVENGQCWAQAGALGQALLNPKEYSRWYPVKNLFWLRQSMDVQIHAMSRVAQMRCLSSSIANVFWDQLPPNKVQTIFALTMKVLNSVPMHELWFPKQERVWETIFEKNI